MKNNQKCVNIGTRFHIYQTIKSLSIKTFQWGGLLFLRPLWAVFHLKTKLVYSGWFRWSLPVTAEWTVSSCSMSHSPLIDVPLWGIWLWTIHCVCSNHLVHMFLTLMHVLCLNKVSYRAQYLLYLSWYPFIPLSSPVISDSDCLPYLKGSVFPVPLFTLLSCLSCISAEKLGFISDQRVCTCRFKNNSAGVFSVAACGAFL